MKRAADTVLKGVTVTNAFRSSISRRDSDDLPAKDRDDPLEGPQFLNLGGLEIPYVARGLNRFEKLYLRSAEYGDVNTARRLIDNAKQYNINVNCTDDMGRGAIRIAIEAEQIELLQMLLTYEVIDLKDCLLHAISEENVQAVELILQAQSERQHRKNLKGLLGHIESSIFTPDITPLILAAHRDNYAIIKILIDRGNKITKPHELRCACNACVQASREDSLQHSKLRINAYRALSSPCFIALSSTDPILTAFELSWETRRLGRLENEFKDDYEKLSQNCEAFATALLAQTRGSTELAIVLNYDSGGGKNEDTMFYGVRSDSTGQTMQLSRLRLAIKYKQKQFVAHPHCQQLLASLWYDGLPGFRRKPFFVQAAIIFLIALLYPVLSLCCLLAPDSRWGNMLRKPFIKFICQSSAYISFLILLTLVALRIEFYLTNQLEQRMSCRDPAPSFFEAFAIVFVVGFVWQEITNIWTLGIRAYISDMWHLLDFAQNSLYISTIALRFAAWLRVWAYGEPSILDRSKWDAYDPILISESLFAIANIFATLKLVYVFTVSPQLGPLQISLGRMLNDIVKFFCVYILVLVAFAFGLNQLYWFYSHERFNSCQGVRFSLAEGMKDVYDYCITRGRYLTNLFEIAQSLYWSTYGLIDLTNFDLEYPHSFTEFIGKLIFGTYSCIAFIVLLNMLIAMMNNSYQQIWEQADTEWKFARSKLWISYFAEGSALAVPFNLLPGRNTFKWLFKCCHCKRDGDDKSDFEWDSIKEKVQKVNKKEQRHATVMRELVNRYLMHRQMHVDGQGVTEDDLNEIKGDISAFRYELLDILRDNGMKVDSDDHFRKVGRLRRRASRRVRNPSWKVSNANLDELDTTEAPEDLYEGVGVSKPSTQATGTVPSVEKPQEFGKSLPVSEHAPAGPSYSNPAFVPEIEISTAEEKPPLQTDDTIETSNDDSITQKSTGKQHRDVHAVEGSSVTSPFESGEISEPTRLKEVDRTDFV
uniref:Transient receptor potential gamma protein n=1 Tax=Echinococcus granulosus TaxID=6210 RepID=A0A068W9F0_ECHGR|nr:transient receptor potential gamma protein [Echinococcus granulosus]